LHEIKQKEFLIWF